RDDVRVDKISESQFREVFSKIYAGELTKETLPDVVVWLSKHENKKVQQAIDSLGLKVISKDKLIGFIEEVIEDNRSLIQEQGENSFGILMGIIMKKLRGKADAALTSKILKEKLKNFIQ
ncbi:GatB/YqeY domain-containing protein, partial [Candidatus Bathyarchaeota archaeon]|nr:GatB/YqeY domain-containing protein [Candidatus Bathyarchaeota archaeon]